MRKEIKDITKDIKKNGIKKYLKYIIMFLGIFVVVPFIIILLINLKNTNPATTSIFPPCLFYELTGIKCAGCGITRAIHQILNLNFKEAFVLNPLLFVYAIFAMYIAIKAVILKLFKKYEKSILKKEITIILYISLIIALAFMILRNIVNL